MLFSVDFLENIKYNMENIKNGGFTMDSNKMIEREKASVFFKNIISEGMAGGLSRKDAIFRARDKTIEFSGFDLSDAINEKYFIPDIDQNEKSMMKYCELFLSGAQKCLDIDRRPTAKSICDRKTQLRDLELNQVNMIIEKLLEDGKIIEDHNKIKTAYYPA